MVSDKFENNKGIICEYGHWRFKYIKNTISPCIEKAEYILNYGKKQYYCEKHYDEMCEVLAELLR